MGKGRGEKGGEGWEGRRKGKGRERFPTFFFYNLTIAVTAASMLFLAELVLSFSSVI